MTVISGLPDPTKGIPLYVQVQHSLPEVPRQVRIETSSWCSMSCKWCHFHGDFKPQTRKKGRMTPDLFNAILDDIASWPSGPEEIVPTNFGEIFMNKDWEWMLQQIATRLPKVRIHIVTTGTLLTPEALERLALVPTLKYVNFSINAFFGETWERIHGVPAKHMLRAVQVVHDFRDRRPDVEVNVSMVHDPELTTEMEKDIFRGYWSRFGSTTVSTVSFAGNPKRVPRVPVTLSCRSVVDGLVIFDNGDVTCGCCFNGDNDEQLCIGHFPDESLMDIWKGEKLKKIVDLHNSGRRAELDLCRTCSFA